MIEVKKVLILFNPIDENDDSSQKMKDGKKLKTLEIIVESYVFTEDNFIKLIIIYPSKILYPSEYKIF